MITERCTVVENLMLIVKIDFIKKKNCKVNNTEQEILNKVGIPIYGGQGIGR